MNEIHNRSWPVAFKLSTYKFLLNTPATQVLGSLTSFYPRTLIMDSRYSTFTLSPINSNPLAIRLTVSNPPINLVNSTFLFDLHKFLKSLSKDAGVPKVVVISSDNKDFWIHHLDLHLISMEYPLKNEDEKEALPLFGANLQLLGELPTIFIAEVNGRAVAGGNELACNMDMRFVS
jgi:enoyl-CoA hydratase/carnithine racemase